MSSESVSTTRDRSDVTSPDNVILGYDVAGLGSRVFAQMIDVLLLALVLVVTFYGVSNLATVLFPGITSYVISLIASGLTILLYLCFFAICEGFTGGRTAAKKWLGLRVVRHDGGAIGMGEAWVRNLFRIIDNVGPGPVLMFFHPQARRLGDLMAGTMVVRDKGASTVLDRVLPPALHLRTPPGPPIAGIEKLGPRDLTALRTFLSRWDAHPAQRARIAYDLSAALLGRMGIGAVAPERAEYPDSLLERIYQQLEEHLAR